MANGMSEQGYLASLRQDLMRSTLTGSIAGAVAAPAALVDAIYRYRNEQRRGRHVPIRGQHDHRPADAGRRGSDGLSGASTRPSSPRRSTAS